MSKIDKAFLVIFTICCAVCTVPLLADVNPGSPLSVVVKPIDQHSKAADIQFVVELTNNSDVQFKSVLGIKQKEQPFVVKVYDKHGVNLHQIKFAAKDNSNPAYEFNLMPYEKRIYPITFSYRDHNDKPKRVPPGTYKVSAMFPLISYNHNQLKLENVDSNEIEIMIGEERSLPIPQDIAIRLAPSALTWIKGEVPQPKIVHVEVIGKTAVKLLSVKSTNDRFSARLRTLDEGGLYEVTVTPADTGDPAAGVLHFETEPPLWSILNLPTTIGSKDAVPTP